VTAERETLECQLAAEVVRSFGELRLRAAGSSMLPAVWPGDVLSVCGRNPDQALPGDIILFARDGRLFAHRVVKKAIHQGTPYWITRGDRLDRHDPQVSPHELLGRITSIHRGHRRIIPRLTFWGQAASWFLRRSDFSTRLLMYFHHRGTETRRDRN